MDISKNKKKEGEVTIEVKSNKVYVLDECTPVRIKVPSNGSMTLNLKGINTIENLITGQIYNGPFDISDYSSYTIPVVEGHIYRVMCGFCFSVLFVSSESKLNAKIEEGLKFDKGKPMIGTVTDVFSRALMAVGCCIEFGTHKYPNPKNWQLVEDGIKRYRDAMMRHLIKYNAGIELDEETHLPHLAHMVWNALAILELYMQQNKDKFDKEIFK